MTIHLSLYNSATGQKDIFSSLQKNSVGMYVCGPTVYDFAHLGNARCSVTFDILFRVLQFKYKNVTYVQNITDVDDKINQAAYQKNISIQQLSQRYLKIFKADMSALNCQLPTHQPLVTEHMPLIIDKIQQLVKNGYAYVKQKHVLFNVQAFPNYGCLSGRCLSDMKAGARVEVASYKRNPLDFVLWKPSLTSDVPGWESPWGLGRPGWHIECTALSAHFLGQTFDIHGGGQDLLFPHHENEQAQGRALGGNYANFWIHNGPLQMKGQKMSKSTGNVFLVNDLLKTIHPDVIRCALLSTHYRQPLNWNDDLVQQSTNIVDKFYRLLLNYPNHTVFKNELLDQDFLHALYNDLNTPEAMRVLQHKMQAFYQTSVHEERQKLLSQILLGGHFLGILNDHPSKYFSINKLDKTMIETFIEQRHEARSNKDFHKADSIRDTLLLKGVGLEDKQNKTSWYYLTD